MPSEYRKQELLGLLGNCVLALALVPFGQDSVIAFAQEATERHVAELDRDYPGWREELR